MTPEMLKQVIEAIVSPNFARANERVYGFIGIYHNDPSSITGVNCVATLPSEYSFLLELHGRVHYRNLEFGMEPRKVS